MNQVRGVAPAARNAAFHIFFVPNVVGVVFIGTRRRLRQAARPSWGAEQLFCTRKTLREKETCGEANVGASPLNIGDAVAPLALISIRSVAPKIVSPVINLCRCSIAVLEMASVARARGAFLLPIM